MLRINFLLLACLIFAVCQSEQQPQQAQSQGLQKVYYKNPEEIQNLRNAGAEIIVQEPDYVVIKTDKMVQTHGLKLETIQETDLVQRLVKIHVKDSTDRQIVVNSGVDLWEMKEDIAIARAYDIYIAKLREAGLIVEIIADDASKWEGKQ
jgi:hypothetical protein